METIKILITGDYWHSEFAGIIREAHFPITLQPFGSLIDDPTCHRDYQLVVVAQSRRSQFGLPDVERLMDRFAGIPVVSLCGSWCEGESRSGTPLPGLIRIYWHQWQGRLESFLRLLEQQQFPSWHLPRICSVADRIMIDLSGQGFHPDDGAIIGISSMSHDGFSMLQHACPGRKHPAIWLERFNERDVPHPIPTVLLVESNSLTQQTVNRVKELQSVYRRVPQILVLNFPRRQEYESAQRLGIAEIVSKPFELADLQSAIRRALMARAA